MSFNLKKNDSLKKISGSISKDFPRKQALVTGAICVCISAFIFFGTNVTKIKSTSNAISNNNVAVSSQGTDNSNTSKDVNNNSNNVLSNANNSVSNNNSNASNNIGTTSSSSNEYNSNKTNSNTSTNVSNDNIGNSTSSTSQIASSGKYKDGEYYGQSVGFKGDVKVKVVVTNGSITNVSVVENVDDADYFNRAEALTEDIVKSNSPDVSVVSGATFSSNGIINAVKNALENASN